MLPNLDSLALFVRAAELRNLKDFAGLAGPYSFGTDQVLRRPAFLAQMAGGDVKMITALALWFPFPAFAELLVVMPRFDPEEFLHYDEVPVLR